MHQYRLFQVTEGKLTRNPWRPAGRRPTLRRRSGPVVAGAVALTLLSAAPTLASPYQYGSPATPPAENMVVDMLIARPIGLGVTVVGSALFLVSLPFTLIGGSSQEAAQRLVADPAHYTFQRPLGQLDY